MRTKILKNLVIFTLMLFPYLQLLYSQNYTYTTNADFDKGTCIGVEHETVHDQLQLSKTATTLPFIWVPNTNEGTVSKVDTRTGAELGRYRTSPLTYGAPSRSTVDLQGSCWIANRQIGTVVKIGLYENGQYIDRNNNGIIETSRDLNGDGNITGDEILPWGRDECVLYEVILILGKEGTYAPGQYTGSYANDYWNPGPRGMAIDAQNNLWAGTYQTKKFYYIEGSNGKILKTIDVSSANHTSYGAIMDKNGRLWSSGHDKNHVLRLDTSNDTFSTVSIGHLVYGLGIDNNNHLFLSGYEHSKLTRLNVLTGTIDWTKQGYYQSRGIAVTNDGDVFVANTQSGTVTRWSNDGVVKANIPVGNQPSGVAVDAEGKVWAVNMGDEYIERIDPATNQVDLRKLIIGGTHYGYSDMTGIISRTITTKIGTWTVIHDSESEITTWDNISWNCDVPAGTAVRVRVRSSNNQQEWSTWEGAINGAPLTQTPEGRYLQIEVTLQILSGEVSPILYDLTVNWISDCGYFYPNPYHPNNELGHFVLCDNCQTTIDIFNAANFPIITFDVPEGSSFKIPWDGKDQNNLMVANGVYFFIIKPATGKRIVGKIAVTR